MDVGKDGDASWLRQWVHGLTIVEFRLARVLALTVGAVLVVLALGFVGILSQLAVMSHLVREDAGWTVEQLPRASSRAVRLRVCSKGRSSGKR